MIEFFVKRPVTTIMFVLVFVVLGVFSYSSLLVERTPKIDFPIVTVKVVYPGATPIEVETLVIKKIEDAAAEVSEIKNMKSQSYESLGFLSIEFLLSADVNVKAMEVKDKVEAILSDLPDDIEKPIIEKYDPLLEPVMELVLSSDTINTRELYEYADKVFKTRLSSIKGVAKVDVFGGKERQINVRLDPWLMKQHYVSVTEVVSALSAKNKNVPAGALEKGFDSLSVRFTGEFQSVQEISDFKISSTDGTTFMLKDIATIEDSFKKVETVARFNGKDVVGLSLNKASDGNGVAISSEFRRRFDQLRSELPKGMDLLIASDSTRYIVNETKDAKSNIVLGIVMTVAILYLFTGLVRTTIIASVIIPTSIISTFFPMMLTGFSINFLTLLAIASALGLLISEALIIIESVIVHLKTKDPIQAAIDGTKEVAVVVLASTGTHLVVFVPIAMMGGIVGKFMQSFGLTVVYATIFSLIASFTLTPMMCAYLMKRGAEAGRVPRLLMPLHWLVALTERGLAWLKNEYRRIFDLTMHYRRWTISGVFLLFLASFFLVPFIDNEFVPKSDEDKFLINITLPQGSTIERTIQVVKMIEPYVDVLPEKKSYLTNIGENGVENAQITVDLVPSTERKRSDDDIIKTLVPLVAAIPDVEVNFERGGMRSGTGEGDVSLNVYGTDYDEMIAMSTKMKQIMEASGLFRSVSSSYKYPKQEVKVNPSQEKLLEYGLSAATVGRAVRTSIYGDDTNVYKEKGEEYDINVELDDRYALTIDDIKEVMVLSQKGLVPVTALGELISAKAIPTIWHRDKRRVIRLDGFLAKGSLGYATTTLDRAFAGIDFPEGSGYAYVGDSEDQAESSAELGKAFLLAAILTFMLLCAIMNSLIAYPLAVMTTVLMSFVGIFGGLFFFGQSINIASMLGMVMLVGLVVVNAILMLDVAMIKMQEGVSIIEALWLGAETKFKAIIMTSLSVVIGLMPQLWAIDQTKQSMGAVMIGGMLASIIFTFIFVPPMFYYLQRLEHRLFSRKK